MLFVRQILVIALVLVGSALGLSACGQQGPLYLPTQAAPAQRGALPQTLRQQDTAGAPKSDTAATSRALNPPAPPASAPTQ